MGGTPLVKGEKGYDPAHPEIDVYACKKHDPSGKKTVK